MCKYAIYILHGDYKTFNWFYIVLYFSLFLCFNHHLYDFSPLLSLMIFCISNNDIMLLCLSLSLSLTHTHTQTHKHTHIYIYIYIYISDEVLSACAGAVHPVNDTQECRHVAPKCHYWDAYIWIRVTCVVAPFFSSVLLGQGVHAVIDFIYWFLIYYSDKYRYNICNNSTRSIPSHIGLQSHFNIKKEKISEHITWSVFKLQTSKHDMDYCALKQSLLYSQFQITERLMLILSIIISSTIFCCCKCIAIMMSVYLHSLKTNNVRRILLSFAWELWPGFFLH